MFEEVVLKLIDNKLTVSTMESCTGGGVVNAITNVPGASDIIKYSAVTYSNEFKIKMGVDSKIIDKYSVYSIEVAHEMAKCISSFTDSDFGIGVTGKINKADKNNPYGEDNVIFASIYDKKNNKYNDIIIKAIYEKREDNKNYIISEIAKNMNTIIDNYYNQDMFKR